MPLLRITCPPPLTERFIELLLERAEAYEISVLPTASRVSGGDVILADVPRQVIDRVLGAIDDLDDLDETAVAGLHISIEPSQQLFPRAARDEDDSDAVVWAEVTQEVGQIGRLSSINVTLLVAASMIAALGIIQGQLLLVVGAMALSPDYYPIALTCLGVVQGDWQEAKQGIRSLVVLFTLGIAGAFALTGVLVQTGVVTATTVPSEQFTQFISQPDLLTVVVAVIAGVAGSVAVTLPDARGIVGVLVSVTTIPAAADMGIAIVARDASRFTGAAVQLLANVTSLLVAGVVTLAIRRQFPTSLGAARGRRLHL